MLLNIKLELPDDTETGENQPAPEYITSAFQKSFPAFQKPTLESSYSGRWQNSCLYKGIPCFECPKSK